MHGFFHSAGAHEHAQEASAFRCMKPMQKCYLGVQQTTSCTRAAHCTECPSKRMRRARAQGLCASSCTVHPRRESKAASEFPYNDRAFFLFFSYIMETNNSRKNAGGLKSTTPIRLNLQKPSISSGLPRRKKQRGAAVLRQRSQYIISLIPHKSAIFLIILHESSVLRCRRSLRGLFFPQKTTF